MIHVVWRHRAEYACALSPTPDYAGICVWDLHSFDRRRAPPDFRRHLGDDAVGGMASPLPAGARHTVGRPLPSPASPLMARSNCSVWSRSCDFAVAQAALGFDPFRRHSSPRTESLGGATLRALGVPGLGLALRQEPAGGTHLLDRPLADRDPGPRHRSRRHARVGATGEAARPANRQPRLGEVGDCEGRATVRVLRRAKDSFSRAGAIRGDQGARSISATTGPNTCSASPPPARAKAWAGCSDAPHLAG